MASAMHHYAISVVAQVHCHYERGLYARLIFAIRGKLLMNVSAGATPTEFTIEHKRGAIVISSASWRRHINIVQIQKRRRAPADGMFYP
jgi:hypothetical protein